MWRKLRVASRALDVRARALESISRTRRVRKIIKTLCQMAHTARFARASMLNAFYCVTRARVGSAHKARGRARTPF